MVIEIRKPAPGEPPRCSRLLSSTEAFSGHRPARLFRWPGARWHLCDALVPRLQTHLQCTGGRLLSLFHGTGALEQSIDAKILIGADANPELRALHTELSRDCGAEAFHELVLLDGRGAPRARKEFERVRALNLHALSGPQRVARFLWLSGLLFNGIWRVNRAGELNVSADPRRLAHAWPFPVCSALAAAAQRLPTQPLLADWREVLDQSRPGDLILSDPPYLSGFNAYTSGRFSLAEQHVLADALCRASLKLCAVLAFNSADAHPLYRRWAKIESIDRPGRMNCRADRRGPVAEILAITGLRKSIPEGP